jgi:hypothetical protein
MIAEARKAAGVARLMACGRVGQWPDLAVGLADHIDGLVDRLREAEEARDRLAWWIGEQGYSDEEVRALLAGGPQ